MTAKERLIDLIQLMPDEKIEQIYMLVVSLDEAVRGDGISYDDVPDEPRRGVLGPPRRPHSRERSSKGPMFPMKEGETIEDVLTRLRGALVDDGRSYEELRDEVIEELYWPTDRRAAIAAANARAKKRRPGEVSEAFRKFVESLPEPSGKTADELKYEALAERYELPDRH